MGRELRDHKSKCRLCISSTTPNTKIIGSVQQKFFSLTNIELNVSDKFSNFICKVCLQSLNDSSEFQHKMIDNQRRLFAFENEAESAIIKKELLEPSLPEEFLDLQIKTEAFDCEVAQFNEHFIVQSAFDFQELQDLKTNSNVTAKIEEQFCDEQMQGALEAATNFKTTSEILLNRKIHKRCRKSFPTENDELQVRMFVKNRSESGIQSTDEDIISCAIRILKERRVKFSPEILSSQWVKKFRELYSDLSELQVDNGPIHSCDLCDFSTDKKNDLRRHMEFHAELQLETVPKRRSNREYSKTDLDAAVQAASSGSMSASAASKLFKVPKSTLLRDLHSLKGAKVFNCSYCEKVFFNASTKRSHEKTAHLTPAGEFPCSECSKVYPTKEKLNVHFTYAHKVGGFRCSRCGQEFDRQYEMDKHFLEAHRPKVPCEICGKLIFKGNRYTSHLKTHAPDVKCPFEGCANMYHDQKSMKYHIQNTHAPKQNILCPKCSSTFPNADKLKRHDERSHGEARFVCKVSGCHYKSPRKDYLKLHLRNHKNIDVLLRDELIAQL